MNPFNIFDACRTGDISTAEILYRQDADSVNMADAKGFTPLILAAYSEQAAIVDFLLAHGAVVNAQDAAGNTALMGVCFKGYAAVARKLIDAGADVNIRNSNGATALTLAATFGQLQIAEWLLQTGAATGLADARGKTPLDYAFIQKNEAMMELIQRYIKQEG